MKTRHFLFLAFFIYLPIQACQDALEETEAQSNLWGVKAVFPTEEVIKESLMLTDGKNFKKPA
ncbi:MAG: hypothetical protein O2829_05785 [Bacteroidetes bacterium]|nr:hypothetical protein [Bacteroidota bacterium]MDA1268586.1 hypothetical protein [Bacteroidota bacterium]